MKPIAFPCAGSCRRAWLGAGLRLWMPVLMTLGLSAQERMSLERREPDYRFRMRAEYRVPGQRRLALALRGGSAKGLAHLGVFQGLDAENLPADAITGTSAGSLMGSLYASGFSGEGIATLFRNRDFGIVMDDRWREPGWSLSEDERAHATLFSFAFRHGRLDLLPGGIRSRKMRLALMPLLGRAAWMAGGDFDRLRMPLRVVTSDLTDGRGRVFASGSLVDVVMASTCLPGIFEPVEIDGHQFVDGGPYENLPVLTSRAAFPEMAQVGVAIGRPWNREAKGNVLTLMDASLDLAMAQTEQRSGASADLLIRPDMTESDEFDFHNQVDALTALGRSAFDAHRLELERLIYGPQSERPAASSVQLADDGGIPEAKAWLETICKDEPATGPLPRRALWRVLRRAHTDLPIAGAEITLGAGPQDPATLRLIPAPMIRKIELDLPEHWTSGTPAQIRAWLAEPPFALAEGQRFREGTWGRALEALLVRAVLNQAPILDLQGSGLQPDGTLVLRVREPRIHQVLSVDTTFQRPLARFLEPLRRQPVRTDELAESLNRASTRLGLSRLLPELREDSGQLNLVLKPQKAPSLELQPQFAYESAWGGHVGLDIGSPDVLGTGTQLQLHGAVNDLQTRLQGHLLGVSRALPSVGLGLSGSLLRQWFPTEAGAPDRKIMQGNVGLRFLGRFGMEDRGLLQVDLGQARGYSRTAGVLTPTHRANWMKAAFEWDSFDYHTLPTDGFLVRGAYSRAFHAQEGPMFTEGYLRLRRLWGRLGPEGSPVGLDLDAEVATQKDAPMERWSIVGGSESFIGSHSARYLAPNMAILRTGFPFTAATFLGVAIQAVPRIDIGRIAPNYQELYRGDRVIGYGLVLRGALKSLYLELAAGRTEYRDAQSSSLRQEKHLSFLIGSRPFDLWKGR